MFTLSAKTTIGDFEIIDGGNMGESWVDVYASNKLWTPRLINNVAFDGTADINIDVSCAIKACKDVSIVAETEGQHLVYSAGNKWKNITPVSPAMYNLADTTITNPTNRDTIFYNDTLSAWGNRKLEMADMSSVELTDVAEGNILCYNATSEKWINTIMPSTQMDILTNAINALADVYIKKNEAGHAVLPNGAEIWVD